MEIRRRTFLQALGLCAFGAAALPPARSYARPRGLTGSGREARSRCPLCSAGCGVIYSWDDLGGVNVEGDPDCPVAAGSLCPRGVSLIGASAGESEGPLYRGPGRSAWEKIGWETAIARIVRRVKDFRDRELRIKEEGATSFTGLGVLSGGSMTNEEAYLCAKLFRSLGVVNMDTTVRAVRGMAVSGLLDVLGLPGSTHPLTQIALADVVLLAGCNPGQTAPVISRALDEVRRRRGTVIVLDPRWIQGMRQEDIWLRIRPGTDAAVMGAFISWILERGEPRIEELVNLTDAPFLILSELDDEYQKYGEGKFKGWPVVDGTLSEPNSIYQRMRRHFERYSLRKAVSISGADMDLLRRACTELERTGRQPFAACVVLGSGATAGMSGAEVVRMAVTMQALLGNLKKRGGGVAAPVGAGNAQGVCDMGLLSPYLPGYLPLPDRRKGDSAEVETQKALEALAASWFEADSPREAVGFLPSREEGEQPTLGSIAAGIGREVRAMVVIGADPLASLPDSVLARETFGKLDLLVVMDVRLNRTARFWTRAEGGADTLKTEVFYFPIEAPALRSGTMTSPDRRVLSLNPCGGIRHDGPTLLRILGRLGSGLKELYSREGGALTRPLRNMKWSESPEPEAVAREINGVAVAASGARQALPAGLRWSGKEECGNRLYRGWFSENGWRPSMRDAADPMDLGLFERWGWFWPGGVADPFSWVYPQDREKVVLLRWQDQGGTGARPRPSEVLPIRPNLPVRFWNKVPGGVPFPEHYEPYSSPMTDLLTAGRSALLVTTRKGPRPSADFVVRQIEGILKDFPVVLTMHRVGNLMGAGDYLSDVPWLAELGMARVVEMGMDLAASLGVKDGERVRIRTPQSSEGITALAAVTRRVRPCTLDSQVRQVASVTLSGQGEGRLNEITGSAFDMARGGLEVKVMLARIDKVYE